MATNTDIIVTVRGRDMGATETLNGVANAADKSMSSFSDSVKRAGVIAAGALTGIVVAANKMLDVAGFFEQTKIAFDTMTGSGEKAAALMQKLSDFAVRTPFTISGVMDAARQLMAMGSSLESVLPDLKMLGDIASGTGTDLGRLVINFGQVQLQGKLTGRDLRDFAMEGVGLMDELAKETGKSTAQIMEMTSAGEISFKMVRDALINMTSGTGKFADLMAKQSLSFKGIMSNIQDQITRTVAAIMGVDVSGNIREGSIFAVAKQSAQGFLDVLNKMSPVITKVSDAIAKNQVAVFGILGAVIGLAVVAFVGFFAFLAGSLGTLALVVGFFAMLGVWIALFKKSIEDASKSIQTFWIPAIQKARDWVVTKFTEIKTWFETMKTTVSTTISDMATRVVSGFNTLVTNIQTAVSSAINSVINFLTVTAPNAIVAFATSVYNALTAVGNFIQTIPSILGNALYEFVFGVLPFVAGVIWGFFTVSIPNAIAFLAGVLFTFFTVTVPTFLINAYNAFIAWGVGVITEVSTWPGRFQAWIDQLILNVQTALINFGIAVMVWLITTGVNIINEVSTWPGRFQAWITTLINNAIAAVTKFGTDTKNSITATGTSIIAEVSTWPKRFMDWLNTLPPQAEKMLSDLWNAFTGWLGKIGQTFEDWKNKAVGAWNAITGAIQGAINKAQEAFQKGVGVGGGLHFQTGGIVPGPIGSPVLATVHGGEEIVPTSRVGSSQSGGGINFNVTIGLYAGSEIEKRNIARSLYSALLQVANSQNKTVAELMGG